MNARTPQQIFHSNYDIGFPVPADSFDDFLSMAHSGELTQRLGDVEVMGFDSPADPRWNGELIPFMWTPQQESPHYFCFDTRRGKDGNRGISVFSIHTTVHDWLNFDDFLQWVRMQLQSQ